MSNRFSGLRLRELASAPATPASGLGLLYVKNDGHIYSKNDAGTEYRLSGNDPAPSDSGWIAPALANGWANYGAPFSSAGYRKIGEVVYLRGLVRYGTGAAFTLPAGYRPTSQLLVSGVTAVQYGTMNGSTGAPTPNLTAIVSSHQHGMQNHTHATGLLQPQIANTSGRVDITTAGAVTPSGDLDNTFVSLDGICFLAS